MLMSLMLRLSPETARRRAEQAARALAADGRVRLVFLFGSSAESGRHIPVRDVDLAVLTDPPLNLYELMDLRAEAVRTGGEVDLISLNEASIVLAHEVTETGLCLYTSSPELETDFVLRTRMRYLDFKHYLDEQWRLTGERLDERRRGFQG